MGLEIQIQQSFEMRTMPTDGDDDSEKNLVTRNDWWTAECYAESSNAARPSIEKGCKITRVE